MRVGERHINSRGGVHGGVLSTLTDDALGYGTLAAHGETLALVTASLTIDFTGCEITSAGWPVASGSGVFSPCHRRSRRRADRPR